MENEKEKKVIKKIYELERNKLIRRLRRYAPIEFFHDRNRLMAEIQLNDLNGNSQGVITLFANADGDLPIEKALQAVVGVWGKAKYLLWIERSNFSLNELLCEVNDIEELREMIDASEAIKTARQYFPIEVTISDGLINLGIDLIDKDTDIGNHIDLKVRNGHLVCHIEALFAMATLWSWREEFKKFGISELKK